MEFQHLQSFFKDLISKNPSLKRKQPFIVTYLKYLDNRKTTDEMNQAVDYFKQFLLQNTMSPQPSCSPSFDHPEFITGKPNVVLNMNVFTKEEGFWKNWYELETFFFPQGKPEAGVVAHLAPPKSSVEALNILKQTPMFTEVASMIENINPSDSVDIQEVIQKEECKNMIKKIQTGLSSGRYNLSDLTSTVKTIIDKVRPDMSPEVGQTLSVVSQTMTAVEQGNSIDVGQLLQSIEKFNPNISLSNIADTLQ